MTIANNHRQLNPDFLKTISILGVVYIHCFYIVGQDTGEYLAWVSRIAVPCFIILWAYFAEMSVAKGKSFLEYVPRRFLHLFTVFVTWSLVYLLLKDSWSMPTVGSWLVRHFSGGAWAGQYFFLILFQLLVLFYVIRRLYAHRFFRIGVCIAVAVLYVWLAWFSGSVPEIIQKLKFRPFIYSLPYVFLGIALARDQIPQVPKIALTALALVPLEFATLTLLGKSFNPYLTPSVMIAASTVAALAITRPSVNCPPLIEKCIRFVGANTLVIFVANPLMISIFANFLKAYIPLSPHPYLDIPLALLLAICVLATCSALAWGIGHLRLKTFFG